MNRGVSSHPLEGKLLKVDFETENTGDKSSWYGTERSRIDRRLFVVSFQPHMTVWNETTKDAASAVGEAEIIEFFIKVVIVIIVDDFVSFDGCHTLAQQSIRVSRRYQHHDVSLFETLVLVGQGAETATDADIAFGDGGFHRHVGEGDGLADGGVGEGHGGDGNCNFTASLACAHQSAHSCPTTNTALGFSFGRRRKVMTQIVLDANKNKP